MIILCIKQLKIPQNIKALYPPKNLSRSKWMTYQTRENCHQGLKGVDKSNMYSSNISNSNLQVKGHKVISTCPHEYLKLILTMKRQQRSSM